MLIVNLKNKKGFTLIELMVSIALFSIVVVVVIGSIITVVDANKKARSLMTGMNNVSFAIDSITRSVKAGDDVKTKIISGYDKCITTEETDYKNTASAREYELQRRTVDYCLGKDSAGYGKLVKIVEGDPYDLTSPDIDIVVANSGFKIFDGTQPRVLINIKGQVKVSPKVSSDFLMQTTVAQRQLEI